MKITTNADGSFTVSPSGEGDDAGTVAKALRAVEAIAKGRALRLTSTMAEEGVHSLAKDLSDFGFGEADKHSEVGFYGFNVPTLMVFVEAVLEAHEAAEERVAAGWRKLAHQFDHDRIRVRSLLKSVLHGYAHVFGSHDLQQLKDMEAAPPLPQRETLFEYAMLFDREVLDLLTKILYEHRSGSPMSLETAALLAEVVEAENLSLLLNRIPEEGFVMISEEPDDDLVREIRKAISQSGDKARRAYRTVVASAAMQWNVVLDAEGSLVPSLRKLIEGMTVSIDISTGEDDAGARLFGTISEVQDSGSGDRHGVTLLVNDAESNT